MHRIQKPQKKKRYHSAISFFLSVLLFSLSLINGCSPKTEDLSPTTAAPFQEETDQTYEQFEEKQLEVQKDFDLKMEEVFRKEVSNSQIDLHFMLKDPAAFGITECQNVYGPVSLEAIQESRKEQQELRELLDSYDPALLTEDQKLTLRILQSLLRTEKMGEDLELYEQPLAVTIGVQAQLPILLSEYIFYQKQDVEDYFNLLSGIDEYYSQIMDFQRKKAEAGLMMSDSVLDHVIESCEGYLLVPGDNFMIETFNSRLDTLTDLTEEEKAAYRQRNEELLESDFVPAYQLLIDGLNELRGKGTNEKGLSHFPKGKEYYEYLVYSATGTSYSSVDDMLKAMERTMVNQLMETSNLLRSNPELMEELDSYCYRQTKPEDIMEELKRLSPKQFPPLPQCNYTLKTVPKSLELSLSPAFYLVSPLDDYQDNVIFINENPRYATNQLYNTLAHEGYPGHLYQNVYFHTHCDCNLRKLLSFKGYSEGWASYVEHLSYTMDNGLKPEMGQLLAANSLATLGIHACLDVYINYMGWDKEQVKDYLKYYYEESDEVVNALYSAMIENPANYLSYYVGCMEFLNMRETAQKELGDRFDPVAFHTFLLSFGDAPFDVIQSYFTTWLSEQKEKN